ncbi:riboflavin synthase [Thermosulfurimonas dismutans]|uniref:Riboflavin synthase n=1 Tax=Thermosulfurimonas dismutans TaxID=999894 RepID=A0A179D6A1_9BACT|nr:riboflavin synthase [Thermosulfurimonas dismutans]OAQ21566.1 Riboflavin synthase eubacterial/eukaryotic [Thermosulfurimonas dismutans]
MFTGLVEGLGTIKKIRPKGGGLVLGIEAPFSLENTRVGDSVAVNGACLTVVALEGQIFEVDVSPETLMRTTLGELKVGDRVNLERALRLGDRLGGHLVTGHVDGIGRVVSRENKGNFFFFRIWAPSEVSRYLVEKGSVAVDGVSLTVNRVFGEEFELAVIPHTASLTTLGFRKSGDRVNLEADLLAKYVEKFLSPYRGGGDLSEDFLKESGFF